MFWLRRSKFPSIGLVCLSVSLSLRGTHRHLLTIYVVNKPSVLRCVGSQVGVCVGLAEATGEHVVRGRWTGVGKFPTTLGCRVQHASRDPPVSVSAARPPVLGHASRTIDQI